jgi:hypothetical protein
VIPTYSQTLRALDAWLDKASAFELEAGRDPGGLMGLRLAPDMYPLATQALFCCVQTREVVHRLRHETPGSAMEVLRAGWDSRENPTSLESVKAQIRGALEFLAAADADDLDANAAEPLALDLPSGHIFDISTGERYVADWALSQLYFHLMAAYLILRNHGVPLGKVDYIPWMLPYLRPGSAPQA